MLKRLVNMLAINTSVNVDRNHKYLTFIEYLLTAHYCAKCVPWIAVFFLVTFLQNMLSHFLHLTVAGSRLGEVNSLAHLHSEWELEAWVGAPLLTHPCS